MKNANAKKIKYSNIFYIIGILCIILINVLAWWNSDFCDFYVRNIFPIWGMTYGRLTSLFPFSIGEIMLYCAVALTIFGVLLVLINAFPKVRKSRWHFFSIMYGKCYAWTFWCVLWIMTLNCFVLYHTTGFEAKYEPSALAFLTITEELDLAFNDGITGDVFQTNAIADVERQMDEEGRIIYSYDDLATLRDYIVEKCNRLAYQMERDENGKIVYTGDIKQASVEAMQKMGSVYDQLDGFYVTPKNFACSDFFSQQYIMGYYFPFSMEANINDMMYITNVAPATCHELAHTKGFIYEDDANMIGYLACINADDPFVEYCGYLSVLNYVNNDFFESIGKSKSKYKKHVRIDPIVCEDNIFLTDDAWEEVEKKAVVSTRVVNKVSSDFTNATLKLNGVEQGMMQYNEVVDQLLHYYDGLLY